MKKKRYLPFGYQMEKGEIIPHPDEGPLVQAIFSKYIERAALSTLAKYASLSGIPYREGAGQWNKTMICRIWTIPSTQAMKDSRRWFQRNSGKKQLSSEQPRQSNMAAAYLRK